MNNLIKKPSKDFSIDKLYFTNFIYYSNIKNVLTANDYMHLSKHCATQAETTSGL